MNRKTEQSQFGTYGVAIGIADSRLSVNGMSDRPKSEEVKRTLETCLALPPTTSTVKSPWCSRLAGPRWLVIVALGSYDWMPRPTCATNSRMISWVVNGGGLSVPVVSA